MSMARRLLQLISAIVLVAAAGCAGTETIDGPSDSSRGMVIGHFDYSDSKHIITAITLDPADRISVRMGGRGERVHIYKNGTFFADDLKPGKYSINALYSGNVVFSTKQKMEVTVGPGEIRYIGTYKLNIDSPALFSRTGGSIKRTDRTPNERQLLEKVRELVKDTGWRVKVDKRIAQLKGS
jgi:hypothetical protein